MMINLNNNFEKLIGIIILIVFIMFAYYLTPNKNFYNRMLKNRIKEEYNGKVEAKYIDSANHMTPKLKLSSKTISLENTFWDEVNIGDSIVKIKGNAIIKLYKTDNSEIIFDYNKYIKKLSDKNELN